MALLALEGVEKAAALGFGGLQFPAVLPRDEQSGDQADDKTDDE